MSVWLTIPSARPPEQVNPMLKLWHDRGYHVAVQRDPGAPPVNALIEVMRPYQGYAHAVNSLIAQLRATVPSAEWFIAAGDDTEPDPDSDAQAIAASLGAYFAHHALMRGLSCDQEFAKGCPDPALVSTFGVMQPTGDRWHEGIGGFDNAPIDRVCGSAWYGREYCRRMYGGRGPLWPGYTHMFVDEEAQEVALKMGVLWQRRDLVQKHCHWGRGATDQSIVTLTPGLIPPHLEKWNTQEHWAEAKALFTQRKAAGFPGHEPLP